MQMISFLFSVTLTVGMGILGNWLYDAVPFVQQLSGMERELQMVACLGGAMIVLVLMKLLRFSLSLAVLTGLSFVLGLWGNINEGVSFAELARQFFGG